MSLPSNWPALFGFMVTATMIGTTLSYSYPLLSFVLEREGVAIGLIGLNAALSGLAVFVLAPWLPRLVNYLGPVASVGLGQTVCVLSLLAFPLQVDLLTWSVLRFLLGGGVALAWIACESAVNALAEERSRARVMAVYATLFCVGYALGPVLIGFTGSEGLAPFLTAALLILCGVPPLMFSGGAREAMATPGSADLPRVLRLAPLAMMTILAFGFVETTMFALMPVYGLGLGHHEGAAGLLLSLLIAGNVVFQLPIGWLADRTSRQGTLLGCVGVGLASLLLWPWLMHDLAQAAPILLIGGGALGGLYSLSLTLLGERFRGGDLAVANTAFVLLYQAGAMAGPALVGLLMGRFGQGILPFALAVALALLLAVVVGRRAGARS
ncbi:MAG: MFS transporter [Geminicoccaceae bacterium]|nr:MFS transporter [Geminicoccaceae bacterium]